MGIFDRGFGVIIPLDKKWVPIKNVEGIQKILDDYGLTISEMWNYFCKYAGGHPEQKSESSVGLWFGAKDGKLIFFNYKDIFFKGGLILVEGRVTREDIIIRYSSKFMHLFDIPIDKIDSVPRCSVASPKDASVFIDWNDGKILYSAEFRFAGLGALGQNAAKRAVELSNTLSRMINVFG